MKNIRSFLLLLLSLLLTLSLLSCAQVEQPFDTSDITTHFLDIPGITEEEITAIRALQEKYDYLVYGAPLSTETFLREDGSVGGFSALMTA